MVPFFLHFPSIIISSFRTIWWKKTRKKRPGGDVSSASLAPLPSLTHRLKRSTGLLTNNNNMKLKVKKKNNNTTQVLLFSDCAVKLING